MKFLNTLTKKFVAIAATVAIAVGITGVAMAGFGPDRPTLQFAQPMNGFDHPQFNSIIGVPEVGDERDFFRGVVVGRDGRWIDPVNDVAQDAEVEARIYIHNNADIRYNSGDKKGVAKNVTVKVDVPSGTKQAQELKATIAADNAQPQSIFDTLSLTGQNSGYFELEPIVGSGKLYRDGQYIGGVDVGQLTGGTGVNLGDQEGCFEEIREITFRLKVKMPHYTVSKLVRLEGQTRADWKESIQAQPGQMLEYAIEFDNIGRTVLEDVVIVDDLPDGMVAEPNSVKLYDGNFPNGTPFNNDVIQRNGTQLNALVGDVSQDANFIIVFKSRLPGSGNLDCGLNTFANKAYATPKGYRTIMDEATTTVNKTCEEVVVKECRALNVAKINRTTFDFSAVAYVQNATVTNYVFTARDKDGNVVDTRTVTTNELTAAYRFQQNAPGTYKVKVVVNTDKGVATDSGNCEKTVTVDKAPKAPVYSCKDVMIEKLGDRKVKVSVAYEADPADRVKLKNFEYNFGDGTTPLVTDKNPVEYAYAKDGTYGVAVRITFSVDGVDKTVNGDQCKEVVTISVPTQPKPPTTLPNTGAGSLAGVFAATSIIGALFYRAYAARKF